MIGISKRMTSQGRQRSLEGRFGKGVSLYATKKRFIKENNSIQHQGDAQSRTSHQPVDSGGLQESGQVKEEEKG